VIPRRPSRLTHAGLDTTEDHDMNRTTYAVALVLVVVAFSGYEIGFAQTTRILPYDPDRPILDRSVIGDSIVLVKKNPTTPFVPGYEGDDLFQQEIRRLANSQTIATVTIGATEGAFSDRGTWVRTRVEGQSNEVLKGGGLFRPAGFVEFWHDGGQVQSGSVTVIAGPYPRFVPGQRYLVFLRFDEHRDHAYPSFAYHISSKGTVEAVADSEGGRAWPLPSSLIGRPALDPFPWTV
jgi:hypothetical protein